MSVPSSIRLAKAIRYAISDGKYIPHASLPSHRELAKQHGVSVRTIRQSLDLLEREGLLYRKERSGTFVRGPIPDETLSTAACPVKCINFVEECLPVRPAELGSDYLAGYTAALEDHDIKMRFFVLPEGDVHFERLFSDRFSYNEQVFIFVNRVRASLLNCLNERKVVSVVQYYRAYSQDGLPPHHCVYVNKTGGAFDAVKYLVELGHQRIGFIGDLPDGGALPAVYDGYRSALACGGLEVCPEYTLNFASDEAHATVGVAEKFLRRKDRPTAIMAQTDAMAIAVLEAARSLGIRVPEQLSVVGFNDRADAAAADPPLTTVFDPRHMLARLAVEMALAAASGKYDSYQRRVLDCRLVVRASTAPPGA